MTAGDADRVRESYDLMLAELCDLFEERRLGTASQLERLRRREGEDRPAHRPFEACSAFTRVTACTLAASPYFVTRWSPEASTASLPPQLLRLLPAGASRRVGLSPTGKRRLCTAHPLSGHSLKSRLVTRGRIVVSTQETPARGGSRRAGIHLNPDGGCTYGLRRDHPALAHSECVSCPPERWRESGRRRALSLPW
jgi:hypothetical protein